MLGTSRNYDMLLRMEPQRSVIFACHFVSLRTFVFSFEISVSNSDFTAE